LNTHPKATEFKKVLKLHANGYESVADGWMPLLADEVKRRYWEKWREDNKQASLLNTTNELPSMGCL
jgi:hypothetical protein